MAKEPMNFDESKFLGDPDAIVFIGFIDELEIKELEDDTSENSD